MLLSVESCLVMLMSVEKPKVTHALHQEGLKSKIEKTLLRIESAGNLNHLKTPARHVLCSKTGPQRSDVGSAG